MTDEAQARQWDGEVVQKQRRHSLETLRGLRYSMAKLIRLMRNGQKNVDTGTKLIYSMTQLAKVIDMEEKGRMDLTKLPIEVLRDEILRRRGLIASGQPTLASGDFEQAED